MRMQPPDAPLLLLLLLASPGGSHACICTTVRMAASK
jgi:hypothetical protein